MQFMTFTDYRMKKHFLHQVLMYTLVFKQAPCILTTEYSM